MVEQLQLQQEELQRQQEKMQQRHAEQLRQLELNQRQHEAQENQLQQRFQEQQDELHRWHEQQQAELVKRHEQQQRSLVERHEDQEREWRARLATLETEGEELRQQARKTAQEAAARETEHHGAIAALEEEIAEFRRQELRARMRTSFDATVEKAQEAQRVEMDLARTYDELRDERSRAESLAAQVDALEAEVADFRRSELRTRLRASFDATTSGRGATPCEEDERASAASSPSEHGTVGSLDLAPRCATPTSSTVPCTTDPRAGVSAVVEAQEEEDAVAPSPSAASVLDGESMFIPVSVEEADRLSHDVDAKDAAVVASLSKAAAEVASLQLELASTQSALSSRSWTHQRLQTRLHGHLDRCLKQS